MDAGLQQSNALYATGMNEKEIESADLRSWFFEAEIVFVRDEHV